MALLSLSLSVLILALPFALGRLDLANNIVGIYIDGINSHDLVVIAIEAADVAASAL